MRILVVEDDRKLAHYLKRGLAEQGHVVDVELNGIDGLHFALENQYDLLILDLRLPGIDGFELLMALRVHKQTPVIVLTALDRVEDRVRGLQAGADDYLTKPFAFSELLARIHAVTRRGGQAGAPMSVGDLELDSVGRRVRRGGRQLELTAREFALLYVLLRHRGEVLSRTELAAQVWDTEFTGDSNVVEVAIRRLRSKLDDPYAEKLLHTVRGAGYVLELRDPGPTPPE